MVLWTSAQNIIKVAKYGLKPIKSTWKLPKIVKLGSKSAQN